MRTLVDIDDATLKEAMTLTNLKTKKETINLALKDLVKFRLRQKLKEMAGSGALDMALDELKELRKKA